VTTEPLPGTIGLTPIAGNTGRLIQLGQWLNGEGFEAWEHAFVLLPGNNILEAEPGGARIVPLVYTRVYWCHNIRKLLGSPSDELLNATAESLKGTPYSALDYAALALHRLHIPAPWLKSYIASTGHEICSQLDDDYYNRLAAHIFTDQRWPGYVTPASLYQRDRQLA